MHRVPPLLVLLAVVAGVALAPTAAPAATGAADPTAQVGIAPGKIKHVWLIIMENKSYDASFSGLNKNTYLWQTLPKQGALLKQYYGTGHFSQDNYLSMVSGQGPLTDTQADCPQYDKATGTVDASGDVATNPNFGQFTSAAGPNAQVNSNGCVYPKAVPTLFDQLDTAGVPWKGYAQDLASPDPAGQPVHSTGAQSCGAPFDQPGETGDAAFANPGSANATDQYVPKHFPFPWFASIRDRGDCDPQHIADLLDPADGLAHDLASEATTPAFSWISPNNCSDAHDAVCRGNNLSGGFADANTPNPPKNYTGGLYAGDRFLEHVIPQIEASAAFKDGGLIDVTFDEAFPPFTYSGNSQANSTTLPANAATSLLTDQAGETLFGKGEHFEPTGPNTPLRTDAQGNALYPGPGYNSYLDRPLSCVAQTKPSQPADQCLLGGGSYPPAARTDAAATANGGTATIADNAITARDVGRPVSGVGIPAGAYVGKVTNTPVDATAPAQSGGFVDTGEFTLVDGGGQPLAATAAVSGVTLAAQTAQTDPLFTATGQATGGGDVGAVLISPYIKPGTTSDVLYNHYSWLRTMEDLFGVAATSPGLDGLGHVGFAAQPGLAPFGKEIFTADTTGTSTTPTTPTTTTTPAATTPVTVTGPAGAPGAPGAPGPAGPVGPAGTSAPGTTPATTVRPRLTVTERRRGRGISATVKLSTALKGDASLRVRVLAPGGRTVVTKVVTVPAGRRTVTVALVPTRGRLPRRARVRAALTAPGGVVVAAERNIR